MSDTSQGHGWWQATDGKWYPPEAHPDYTPTFPSQARATMPPAPPQNYDLGSEAAAGVPNRKKPLWKRWWFIVPVLLIVAAVVAAVVSPKDDETPAAPTQSATTDSVSLGAPASSAPEEVTVETLPLTTEDSSSVTSPAPTANTQPAPESNLTAPQQNAVRSAESYLDFKGFSRQGLIDQLSSEYGDQFAVEDATVAVDSLNADWNAQAAKSAQSYLDFKGFSCQGLIDQLSSEYGDQFTVEQATFGATEAGVC